MYTYARILFVIFFLLAGGSWAFAQDGAGRDDPAMFSIAGSQSMALSKDDSPRLYMTIVPMNNNGISIQSAGKASGYVWTNSPLDEPLEVSLWSGDPDLVQVTSGIQIHNAGELKEFTLFIDRTSNSIGAQTVTVSATAPGFASAQFLLPLVQEKSPWEMAVPGTEYGDGLTSGWVSDSGVVFSVGYDGKIYSGFLAEGYLISFHEHVDLGASHLYAVTGTNYSNVYVAGQWGNIFHFDGNSWSPMESPVSSTITAMWAADAENIFGVGHDGIILHGDGDAWRIMETPIEHDLQDVWGTSPDDVFAVGPAGPVLHYDGQSWTTMDCEGPLGGLAQYLYSVWGSSSTNVYALDRYDGLYHYDGVSWAHVNQQLLALADEDYSQTWVDPYPNLYVDAYLDVWGRNEHDVYVLKKFQVFHFDGESWHVHDAPSTPHVQCFDRSAPYAGASLDGLGLVVDSGGTTPSLDSLAIGTDKLLEIGASRYCYPFSRTLESLAGSPTSGIIGVGDGGIVGHLPLVASVYGPDSVWESDGILAGAGKVTIPLVGNQDVPVNLESSNPSRLIVPTSVIIPAGDNSAVFDITVVASPLPEGPQHVNIKASLPGVRSGVHTVLVEDSHKGGLTLAVPEIVGEGENFSKLWGKVCIGQAAASNIIVYLEHDAPSKVSMPESVVIQAGETCAEFSFRTFNNSYYSQDIVFEVRASVPGWESASQEVVIRDFTPRTIFLEVPGITREGQTSDCKASILAYVSADLVLDVTIDNGFEIQAPSIVTISKGMNYGVFNIVALDEHITDGAQKVTISVSAPGWEGVSQTITVLDSDPVWESVNVSSVVTGSYIDFEAVWGLDRENVLVAGEEGTLIHYDGMDWTQVISSWAHYYSIWGSSRDDIHVTGYWKKGTGENFYRPAHFDGTAWTLASEGISDSSVTIHDIWGTGPDSIYVVGQDGFMAHWDGSAWTEFPAETTRDLNGIWGTGDDNIYAVGHYGVVLHYDGTEWSPLNSGSWDILYDVWGASPQEILICGKDSYVLHYDGNTFKKEYAGSYGYGLWGNAADDVYMASDSGIRHYDGKTWRKLEGSGHYRYNAVWGSLGHGIYAVGDNKRIKRTTAYNFGIHFMGGASENDGQLEGFGRICFEWPFDDDTLINLWTDSIGQIELPDSVTILAGDTCVLFDVGILDNAFLDGSQDVMIHASAGNTLLDETALRIDDSITTTLTLNLPLSAREDEGVLAGAGEVVMDGVAGADVRVGLICDSEDLAVPEEVIIPEGHSAVFFDVQVINNDMVDGDREVSVTAHVPGWSSGEATTEIRDDEDNQLSIELSDLQEGAYSPRGWVVIPAKPKKAVSIRLSSDDDSELTVPSSVKIYPSSTSSSFYVTVKDDHLIDGPIKVTIKAQAEGWKSASKTIQILDNDPKPVQYHQMNWESDLIGVWGESLKSVVALDKSGLFWRFDGSSWESSSSGSTSSPVCLRGDGSGGLVVADQLGFKTYADASQNTHLSRALSGIRDIWVRSWNDIYILVGSDQLWHCSGALLRRLTTQTSLDIDLVAIGGHGDSSIYGVGSNGYIVRLDGSQWEAVGHFPDRRFECLWVGPGNTVFAFNYYRYIMHYDGAEWEEMDTNSSFHFNDVYGLSNSYLIAVGDAGRMLNYDGEQWKAIYTKTYRNLLSVHVSPANEIFAVGDDGTKVLFLPSLQADYSVQIQKSGQANRGLVTISTEYASPVDRVVQLESGSPDIVTAPESVTIPANETQVSFTVDFLQEINGCDAELPVLSFTSDYTGEAAIELYSSCCTGDVNGDRRLNLIDAIEAMGAMVNGATDCSNTACGDVNGDGKTGAAEALYILHDLAD